MKKLQAQRNLLREALADLEGELQKLRAAKKELQQNLRTDSGKFNMVKSQESRLRKLLALSIAKEEMLLKKKTITKEKLEKVMKRIEKVETIDRELHGV